MQSKLYANLPLKIWGLHPNSIRHDYGRKFFKTDFQRLVRAFERIATHIATQLETVTQNKKTVQQAE